MTDLAEGNTPPKPLSNVRRFKVDVSRFPRLLIAEGAAMALLATPGYLAVRKSRHHRLPLRARP
jgi:hypothetical protein